MDLTSSSWLVGPFVAVLPAALGYAAKQGYELVLLYARLRRERETRLVTLLSLLRGVDAVFHAQLQQNRRLLGELSARLMLDGDEGGYDAVFARSFAEMTPGERELHDVIRGYTVHGMAPINRAIQEWLKSDTEFKITRSKDPDRVRLASQLCQLEAHLHMWCAKFDVWMPSHPERSIVYLADESAHGVAFPKGIESTIENVLKLGHDKSRRAAEVLRTSAVLA